MIIASGTVEHNRILLAFLVICNGYSSPALSRAELGAQLLKGRWPMSLSIIDFQANRIESQVFIFLQRRYLMRSHYFGLINGLAIPKACLL